MIRKNGKDAPADFPYARRACPQERASGKNRGKESEISYQGKSDCSCGWLVYGCGRVPRRAGRGPGHTLRGRREGFVRQRQLLGESGSVRTPQRNGLYGGRSAQSGKRSHRQPERGAEKRAGDGRVQLAVPYPQAGRHESRKPEDLVWHEQPGKLRRDENSRVS